MYAIVETGGKQYRIQEGSTVVVEKLAVSEGEKVVLNHVLAVSKDGSITVGEPFVAGASVEATVIENGKSDKVIVFKYKSKKDYRRKQGHRQPFTKLKIESIKA
ncbi:50S ribosomal protein L21 [Anoxynatronum sibiricum]|uniref:Large ribosomal subunit protein bL21 n=1 Tax=Anoxynatronum sibiricum TaxID=210623 RepID=A0ABU9VYW6_9CLOT